VDPQTTTQLAQAAASGRVAVCTGLVEAEKTTAVPVTASLAAVRVLPQLRKIGPVGLLGVV
jgi:hypothetical protein